MAFSLKVEPEVKTDIQEAIDWYNNHQKGLGKRFNREIASTFKVIRSTPFFQVRYDDTRCLPLNSFPYMVHFTVDERLKTVIIKAVFHTSRNPQNWNKRS